MEWWDVEGNTLYNIKQFKYVANPVLLPISHYSIDKDLINHSWDLGDSSKDLPGCQEIKPGGSGAIHEFSKSTSDILLKFKEYADVFLFKPTDTWTELTF